jgi:hypothetical protein
MAPASGLYSEVFFVKNIFSGLFNSVSLTDEESYDWN